jgi:hypothetical protein
MLNTKSKKERKTMPRRKLVVKGQVEKDHNEEEGSSANILTIADSVLTRDSCDVIINVLESLPVSRVDQLQNGEICPEDKDDLDRSWRYTHPSTNHDVAVLEQGTMQFEQVLELIEPYLPKSRDFAEITYATIMKYPKDSMFQWHKDSADANDTGTCIFMLNEEYVGGTLNVEGHTIFPRRGTMVFFNNSTERWHSVEPIFEGDRYVFAIWFTRVDDDKEDAHEQQA